MHDIHPRNLQTICMHILLVQKKSFLSIWSLLLFFRSPQRYTRAPVQLSHSQHSEQILIFDLLIFSGHPQILFLHPYSNLILNLAFVIIPFHMPNYCPFQMYFIIKFMIKSNETFQAPNNFRQQISLDTINFKVPQEQQEKKAQFSCFCKICLAEVKIQNISQQQLISPCQCMGTMRWVHQECLVEWLNTIVNKNLQNGLNTIGISCQVCKTAYNYQIEQKIVCAPRQQRIQKIKLNWPVFLVGILFILAGTVGIILLSYLSLSKRFELNDTNQDYGLYIAGIVVFCILITLWVIRLILIIFFKKLNYIKKITGKLPFFKKPQDQSGRIMQDTKDKIII